MLGAQKHAHHPKKTVLLKAMSDVIKFPKKIQHLNGLRKKECMLAPRFGGRTIHLWVKDKTRVWVDRQNVFVVQSKIPDFAKEGLLVSAELFKNDTDDWVMAFEDVVQYDGDMDFNARQTYLRKFVQAMQTMSDRACDPGVFSVKPWYPAKSFVKHIRETEWLKRPEWVLIWSNDNIYWFGKIHDKTETDVYRITKAEDPNPDQYDLLDDDGNIVSRACVRNMRLSKWLATLPDGARVRCRKVKGIRDPEPYTLFEG